MRSLLILSILTIMGMKSVAQKELTWSIYHPINKTWIDLGKKGSVQEALIATGELPDPYLGLNEHKFGWIEDHIWEFKSIFFLSKKEIQQEFIELHFPSLDTYAKVFLNDSLIYTGENAFIGHTIRLPKDLINEGLNECTIVFTPPVLYHKEMYETAPYHYPAPNDVHEIAIAPYTRKPQYQFGWDWALRMNTIGLNKTAWIQFSDFGHISTRTTRVISLTEEEAVVEFSLDLSNKSITEIYWESEEFGEVKVSRTKAGFVRKESIKNPNFWWPKGQGEAYLYSESINIKNTDKQIIDSIHFKYGLKTSELVMEEDEWGTSYYFKINGRTIFCKGGDYIPQDIFPARVKDEDIEKMVELMAESNFNMVRVWGGGYYPDEVFFDKCDELGIMVWEDLMFACAMYPGDEAFIKNISEEFRYQIPRIAAHPSVVLINGNNEVEVAWGNWGFQVKHGLYGKSAKEIEQAYDKVFKETAPSIVSEYTNIPYIHTSPLSNWGKDDFYNHGSQHYWGVWHGKDPIEDFGKKIGRFNAEYGFQSFPEYSTLLSFSDSVDWSLDSKVMKHHQKSYVGNEMILKHASRLYGKPYSFEEFVYLSQLTQAKAVSMAVAGHRVDSPRCGGTVYWQVNDCWPAPTWSSVDYNWNWKALQYEVKKDYENIAVVATYNDLKNRTFFLVNDLPDSFTSNLDVELTDLNGNAVIREKVDFWFTGPGKYELKVIDSLLQTIDDENVLISLKWNDNNGTFFLRQFLHERKSYEKAKPQDVELSINEIDIEEKTAIITVQTKSFLKHFWLSSKEFGVFFNDNFTHLLPGKHNFKITFNSVPQLKDFEMKWM